MNAKKAKKLRRQVLELNTAPREHYWHREKPQGGRVGEPVSVRTVPHCARALYQRMKRAIKDEHSGHG